MDERNYGLEGGHPRDERGRWTSWGAPGGRAGGEPLTPEDVERRWRRTIASGVVMAVAALFLGWNVLVGLHDVVDDTPACPTAGACHWGGD